VSTDRLIYEQEARGRGFTRIAGVDEVGRAAWAGPMVAAAVILPQDLKQVGIRSSKKYKSACSRLEAYERIIAEALSVSVEEVSAADIDAKGIDPCHMDLLRRAVEALKVRPDYVLVDHYTIPHLDVKQQPINNGDDLSVSIAAASIVAKVTLDGLMEEFATQYPEYGFDANKGYGTEPHREALREHGPSRIHRLSSRVVQRNIRTSGGDELN
jgi:ribonuclease HII